MGNLAAILWQAGIWDEAYELLRQVVELRRQSQGEDHPAFRAAVAALETMERQAGF